MREVKRMKVTIVGTEKEIDNLKKVKTSTALEIQKQRLIKMRRRYKKVIPDYHPSKLPTL